jgi:hypothetical protein
MKFAFRRRISFLLFLSLSFLNSGFAALSNNAGQDDLINSFFKSLYNFSFQKADSVVLVLKDSKIDDITLLIVKANLSWWKLLSGDEVENNLMSCSYCIDESLRLILKSSKRDKNAGLNIIYLYSLKARLENYKGNTLKAVVNFFKSITYIQEISESPVADEKVNLVLGMYYYFVDYIKTRHFIFNAVLLPFPQGNREKGLEYLEKCAVSDDEMVNTEANYFLMKIYAYSEKEYPTAFVCSKILVAHHPDNLVYKLEQLKLLLKMQRNEEARLFKSEMIYAIQNSEKINKSQKNHFISQIEDLTSITNK